MPTGPRGQKRPADAIGRAVQIAKIATGEIVEKVETEPTKRSQSKSKAGKIRAERLSPEKRTEIAKAAANARWKKDQPAD